MTPGKNKILIIEDEKSIADILQYGLEKEGFQVETAVTGGGGMEAAESFGPSLVLLDWMLPDISGVDVCKILTERYNVPIIMLTARAHIEDKLFGLEAGADDYITKPFYFSEVVARIRTILRRFEKAGQDADESRLSVKALDMTISEEGRSVTQNGKNIDLTPKEFDLLVWFIRHPGQVFTRMMLLEQIWGYDFMGDTRTVDIHVQRLRKKLNIGGKIVTVFGVGYKYVE